MTLAAVASPLPVTVLRWRAYEKQSLRGFATVQVGALRIVDVSVFAHETKRWCNLPAKPMINRDGTVRRTPDGRVLYSTLLEWNSSQAEKRFNEGVLSALEREYPDALTVL